MSKKKKKQSIDNLSPNTENRVIQSFNPLAAPDPINGTIPWERVEKRHHLGKISREKNVPLSFPIFLLNRSLSKDQAKQLRDNLHHSYPKLSIGIYKYNEHYSIAFTHPCDESESSIIQGNTISINSITKIRLLQIKDEPILPSNYKELATQKKAPPRRSVVYNTFTRIRSNPQPENSSSPENISTIFPSTTPFNSQSSAMNSPGKIKRNQSVSNVTNLMQKKEEVSSLPRSDRSNNTSSTSTISSSSQRIGNRHSARFSYIPTVLNRADEGRPTLRPPHEEKKNKEKEEKREKPSTNLKREKALYSLRDLNEIFQPLFSEQKKVIIHLRNSVTDEDYAILVTSDILKEKLAQLVQELQGKNLIILTQNGSPLSQLERTFSDYRNKGDTSSKIKRYSQKTVDDLTTALTHCPYSGQPITDPVVLYTWNPINIKNISPRPSSFSASTPSLSYTPQYPHTAHIFDRKSIVEWDKKHQGKGIPGNPELERVEFLKEGIPMPQWQELTTNIQKRIQEYQQKEIRSK